MAGKESYGLTLQVLIMIKNKKTYVGGTQTEEEAAVLYDKVAIQTQGLLVKKFFNPMQAKTNFSYTKE